MNSPPENLQYARMIAFENFHFPGRTDERRGRRPARRIRAALDTNAVSVVTPGFESGLGPFPRFPCWLTTIPPSIPRRPMALITIRVEASGSSSSEPASSSAPSSSPAWDSSNQVISDSPNPYLAAANPSAEGSPRMSEFIGGDVILADLNQDQSAANAPVPPRRVTRRGM